MKLTKTEMMLIQVLLVREVNRQNKLTRTAASKHHQEQAARQESLAGSYGDIGKKFDEALK